MIGRCGAEHEARAGVGFVQDRLAERQRQGNRDERKVTSVVESPQAADIITPEDLAARLKLSVGTVYNRLGKYGERDGVSAYRPSMHADQLAGVLAAALRRQAREERISIVRGDKGRPLCGVLIWHIAFVYAGTHP
jgi:hypothetical protein